MGCLKLTHNQQPELRVVHGKKAVTSNDWVKRVCSSYPFGMLMPGRHQEINGNPYTYGFNGMERDEEVKGAGKHYSFSNYGYDPRLGRRWRPDAHAGDYPFISPYAYTLNNPLSVVDPDGKDVYLVIWATADGKIGHAGIAVDNYKAVESRVIENGKEVTKINYVKDGTVTYYDLWPGEAVGATNANKDVPASYNVILTTVDDLKKTDVTGAEGYAPDGVVKLSTSYATDQKTVEALEKFKVAHDKYNGVRCNCSDLAEEGIETAAGKQLDVDESIMLIYESTTPNKLFKETAKLPNASVLKDPGDKVDNTFIEGVKGSSDSEPKKDSGSSFGK